MLKDYPIFFNEIQLPDPEKWDRDVKNIEVVNQTEAGTDQVDTIRYGKMTIAAQFNCSSHMASVFATFNEMGSILVKSYDLKKQDYDIRKMRMRSFRSGTVKGSERIKRTNGLYTISFDLEEY